MRQINLDEYTIDIAELSDTSINMTVRGVPDFSGLFLGQYKDVSSNEFDLYYLPHEDTFLAYDIFGNQEEGDQYQLHSYSTLPVFSLYHPADYLEEGKGLEAGVAFRRWLSLQPQVEAQEPTVGMTFKWIWHERREMEEMVHIITSAEPAPKGWPEGEGVIWGLRRRSDGTHLSSIRDNLTLKRDDFRFHQLTGRIVILDEVIEVPSEDDRESYSAWRNSLKWAPGESPTEQEAEYKKKFDITD